MEVEDLKQESLNPLYIGLFEIQHCLKGYDLGKVINLYIHGGSEKLYTLSDFARIDTVGESNLKVAARNTNWRN